MAKQTAAAAAITATAATYVNSETSVPMRLIENIPEDISLQIIARVSRFLYSNLSLVSKSWRAAVNSPELFHTRSLLRISQSSLYLNIRINSSFKWYSEKNTQNSNRTFIPLPSIPQHPVGSSIVALGPRLYVIGGSINDIPSNNVWIFDCRSSNWEMGPRMRVAREFSAVGELNGKIYVMGGCNVDNWKRSINWAEVFDPKTGLWAAIPSEIELRDKLMQPSAMVGSKFYAMADRGGVVLGRGGWEHVPKRPDLGWMGRAAMVDNVLYCYNYLGKIRGYDVEEDLWKELRGVENGLPKFLCSPTMVNFNGKLCMVWEGNRNCNGEDVDIMCAEIEVKRDTDGGFIGNILRLGVILVVPKEATISQCLAVQF